MNEATGVKLSWTAAVDETIGPLRRAYRLEVERVATTLALRFQARVFDSTKPEEEWPIEPGNEFASYPFNLLEDFCETLPICRDRASAGLVLAISKYAPKAAFYLIESCTCHPTDGKSWQQLAAWCFSRDVHDYALRRGWARSRRERSDSPYPEPERKAARS